MGQLFNFADWKIDGMFVFVVVLAYFLGNISPSSLQGRRGLILRKKDPAMPERRIRCAYWGEKLL